MPFPQLTKQHYGTKGVALYNRNLQFLTKSERNQNQWSLLTRSLPLTSYLVIQYM